MSRTGPILAVTIPLACTLTSVSWAISAYLMVRAKYKAQVEIARFSTSRSSKTPLND